MLVTSLCWWLYDGDWFQMLVAESLCWWFFQCIKSVTNILNRSQTSQTCHQHIWSPTSVTNIDVTVLLTWQIQTFWTLTLNKHAKILNIYIVSINSHIWKFSSLFCSPIRGIFAAWNFLMTLKSRILDTYRHHYRNFLPTLSKIQYIERMKYLADRW